MPNRKERNRFPNELRKHRLRACLSRELLADITARLGACESHRYVAVSVATIKALELGWSKPRVRTAATLAKALEISPSAIFTSGFDDSVRRGLPPKNK